MSIASRERNPLPPLNAPLEEHPPLFEHEPLSPGALNLTHGILLSILNSPLNSPNTKRRRADKMRAVFPDVAYIWEFRRLGFLSWAFG